MANKYFEKCSPFLAPRNANSNCFEIILPESEWIRSEQQMKTNAGMDMGKGECFFTAGWSTYW